jgi:acyl transferase domain-containing protein/NADP-dependent 3-hydroxy acid dehydrogenase YdfG
MTTSVDHQRAPLAIVGVSAMFPGSHDAEGFWRDIHAGRDLLGDVPATHWLVEDYYDPDPKAPDKTYARRGGFLEPVDFDPLAWGVPPSILRATDTTQLLALMVAEQALRDASGARFEKMDRSRISVILGVTSAQELISTMVSRLQRPIWVKALRESGVPEEEVQGICDRIADHYVPWEESSFPGLLGNVVAGRIANRLDLGGTNCVVDAACASTFAALNMAMQELWLGDSDLVLAGGADTLNDIFMFMCFSKTPALSLTGDCRPFSDRADGTMLGEGLGMVALRRLADAERDGDPIYAVIRGIGSSSDGRSKSVYAPVPAGQAQALRRAHANAGVEARTVELIEAHGTGTKAGDAAEFEGLRLAFGRAGGENNQWCALGSVKSQIGHTKAAAGAAGLFKAAMALHHQVLPPTIKVDAPNPKLELESSPFYLNTRARPWIRDASHPRRAGVSAFGFGGSNFHVVLEEYTGTGRHAPKLRSLAAELVVLHGADGAEVAAKARRWAARGDEPGILGWAAWSSQREFDASASARLCVVATSGEELRTKLERAAASIESAPTTSFDRPDGSSYGVGARQGGIGLLFPGQGSQYVGMGGDVAMSFARARKVWDEAAGLDFGEGRRVHEMVFPVPRFLEAEREFDELALRATRWTQPSIGCVSLALLRLLEALGVEARAVAGHSFGEVMALHAAGVIAASDVVPVARRRGEVMASAAEVSGGMSAVTGAASQVEATLAAAGLTEVVLANLNAPTQTVISGPIEQVEKAEAALSAAGLIVKRLPVSSAFHSPVVAPGVGPFAAFLEDVAFSDARLPVFSSESGAPYESEALLQRARLARQLASPVRFVDVVEAMADAGVHTFIEVGPSSVLTGLADQILGTREHACIALDRRGQDGVVALTRALAKLSALGVPLQFAALWEDYREPRDPAARTKPKLAVPISGTNYAKPYPPPGGAAELPPPNPPRPAMPAMPMMSSPSPSPEHASFLAMPFESESVMSNRQASPVASAPSIVSAPAVAAVADGWLGAWQESQRQVAQTHALVAQAMADSHAAYLRTTEVSLGHLAAMAGVPMQPMQVQPMQMQPMPVQPMQVQQLPVPPSPMPLPPMPQPSLMPAAPVFEPMRVEPVQPTPAAAPILAAAPAPAAAPGVDLEALMIEIVAEKTGYPAQMLELSMDMEAELGIDSIKRVEILAAVQERAPGLPEIDATHMGTLRTLGEIVDYMRSLMGSVAAPAVAAAAKSASPTPAAAPSVDLEAVMLEVVAEKTGYPAQMLELSMDMEAELGIDSIKRVEILAAVQERAPGLPEVDAGRMGSLRTLGEIVDYMRSLLDSVTVGGTAGATTATAAPTTPTKAVIEGPPLGRYALELVSAPAIGFARSGLRAAGGIAVTNDGGGVGPALVDALVRRGLEARLVDSVPASAGAVVFLGGLRASTDVDAAIAINREALHAARAVAARFAERGGSFVTVQDTGGAFGLENSTKLGARAFQAGLPALIKTAKQEWPTASLVAIDIDRGQRSAAAVAEAVADELLLGGGEIEVALAADGSRRTLRSFASPIEARVGTAKGGECREQSAGKPIGTGDVVVISGGARGVTSACAIAWAARSKARFVLLGRTPLESEPAECVGIEGDAALKRAMLERAKLAGQTPTPAKLAAAVQLVLAGREIRATLAAIGQAGGEARYLDVDVTDAAAVARSLAEVRSSWGPIAALVHGAGVLADKRIAELDDARFDKVFATKIAGLRALLSATADDPLRVLALFSSVSARCGNNGQAAYAMANEVLNRIAYAEAQRRPETLVRALGWGPWEGGMVGPELRDHFAKLGVPMIPLARGAEMFVDDVSSPIVADARQVAVVLGGEPRADALRSAGSDARTLELEIHVGRASHPYLVGHEIAGTVVVPVVLVVEWCSRIAQAFRPDLHLRGLGKLQVLRGIKLSGYEGAGDCLTLRCRQLSNGDGATLGIEVVGPDGALHYRAEASMATSSRSLGRGDGGGIGQLRAWGDTLVYGDALFHTQDFQVIDSLDGIADDGICGWVHGVKRDAQTGWGVESWRTDVAALDGALQLAVLWVREQMGAASLPMAIGELRLSESPIASGLVRAVVRCRKAGGSRAVADIVLLDQSGARLVELREVELVALPDQRRTFEHHAEAQVEN